MYGRGVYSFARTGVYRGWWVQTAPAFPLLGTTTSATVGWPALVQTPVGISLFNLLRSRACQTHKDLLTCLKVSEFVCVALKWL